jgi:hypothetical protein
MSEKETNLGRLFVQEAVKAGTWGIVLLLVMGMFVASIKQDIKEAIAYGVDRLVSDVVVTAAHPVLLEKTRQLVKEGIDYSLTKAAREARGLLREGSPDTPSGGRVAPQKPVERSVTQ